MNPDLPTLTLVMALASLLFAIALTFYWRVTRVYPGFRNWLGGLWLQSIAFACFLLPGQVVGLLLGGSLFLVSIWFVHRGVRKFRGRKPQLWPVLLLFAAMVVIAFDVLAGPRLVARALTISVFALALHGAAVWELVYRSEPRWRMSLMFAAASLLFFMLGNALRLVSLLSEPSLETFFQPTNGQQWLFLSACISVLSWPAAIIAMNGQRQAADLVAVQTKLRKAVRTDPLTGLPNRRGAFEVAAREIADAHRRSQSLAVAMVDVDHFKSVNDRFGHLVGDQVLQRLGEVAQQVLRPRDLAARLGGEEFMLLLPQTSLDDARRVVERVRVAFEQHSGCEVTLSAGLTILQDADRALPDLLRRADAALYQAKAAGRNQVVVQKS